MMRGITKNAGGRDDPSTLTSKRIDDILLLHWLLGIQVDKIIDAVLGLQHGNRQGLSYGHLVVVFLASIL
jgi:hypothetical protein